MVCLTPQGARFDQACAARLARLPGLVLLAGRYEGIDERLIESKVDEELSLGDFVLSGGNDEVLIPFVMGEVIKGVDLAGGVISVDWEWD